MNIAFSLFILLQLEASFSSIISASNSINIGKEVLDTSANLNEIINKNINNKVSGIISTISQLSENAAHSSSFFLLSRFLKSFTQFANNQMNISPQFLLFTPANPHEEFNLEFSQKSLQNSAFDASLKTKFLIHGYFEGLPKSAMLFDSKGINPRSVHIIGHSLGGHVAGFAGKVLQNIGRITGLDAAGPIFQDLPSPLRLNDTDAEFVDAIHTNGAPNILKGLGTLPPYGDIDFFPNGGSEQTNCSIEDTFSDINNRVTIIDNFIAKMNCNHHRVVQLFLESINECKFESVHCTSYTDFQDGKCPPETSVISRMGLYATPVPSLPKHSSFFLKTTGKPPYCIQ